MVERIHTFARWMLWALPIWALLLLLGATTKQPDPQAQFGEFARYVTTNQFLMSHLINSILGAAIGSIGFVGLLLHLSASRVAGRTLAATIAMVLATRSPQPYSGLRLSLSRLLGEHSWPAMEMPSLCITMCTPRRSWHRHARTTSLHQRRDTRWHRRHGAAGSLDGRAGCFQWLSAICSRKHHGGRVGPGRGRCRVSCRRNRLARLQG